VGGRCYWFSRSDYAIYTRSEPLANLEGISISPTHRPADQHICPRMCDIPSTTLHILSTPYPHPFLSFFFLSWMLWYLFYVLRYVRTNDPSNKAVKFDQSAPSVYHDAPSSAYTAHRNHPYAPLGQQPSNALDHGLLFKLEDHLHPPTLLLQRLLSLTRRPKCAT
jgi:hypothetical protein